jgi:hypothetical protein
MRRVPMSCPRTRSQHELRIDGGVYGKLYWHDNTETHYTQAALVRELGGSPWIFYSLSPMPAHVRGEIVALPIVKCETPAK